MPQKRGSGTLISDAYETELASPCPNDSQGRTVREAIHDRFAEDAAAGDKAALKELREWDRAYGPRPKKA